MKVQSVRFGTYQWTAIAEAAKSEGVAASQFIRDAAWARAVLVLQSDPRVAFAFDLAKAFADDDPELAKRFERLLTLPVEDGSQP
jgi:uncharacterized protein (DUF1778 family)